jgi:diguanylate cyclase (GGDEF)-like protein
MSVKEFRRSVLVVGTDALTLHSVRDVFQRADFSVQTASTVWEAERLMRSQLPDALLVEITLPDMDGFAFREKIFVDPSTRDLPFIFLGEEGHTDTEVRALRAQVDDYITRPLDAVVVVTRVQAVIDRRRSYQEVARLDPLTRLLNRPALQRHLSEELLRVSRYGRQISLLLLQLEFDPASVTDKQHTWNNLLLTCLAGSVHLAIRVVDYAGRFGPTQLLVCLPETPMDGAHVVAERIKERFHRLAHELEAPGGTLQIGFAQAPGNGDTLDVLSNCALENMSE